MCSSLVQDMHMLLDTAGLANDQQQTLKFPSGLAIIAMASSRFGWMSRKHYSKEDWQCAGAWCRTCTSGWTQLV